MLDSPLRGQKLATAGIPAPTCNVLPGKTHGINRLDPTELEGDLHSDISSSGVTIRTMGTLKPKSEQHG